MVKKKAMPPAFRANAERVKQGKRPVAGKKGAKK